MRSRVSGEGEQSVLLFRIFEDILVYSTCISSTISFYSIAIDTGLFM